MLRYLEQLCAVAQFLWYQLLSEGRKLADDLGTQLTGVVLGRGVSEESLKALGGYGADQVYYCEH